MMVDPPRLRSEAAGLEALLLRSSRSLEPPDFAEEEVWRRVRVATAAGAAGAAAAATGLATSTAAASSKVVAKTLLLSILKWSALVAVGVPAAGIATGWAFHREAAPTHAVAPSAKPPPVAVPDVRMSAGSPSDATPREAPAVVALVTPATPAASAETRSPQRGRTAPGTASSPAKDVPSALQKEGRSLGSARAKFAAGDPRGALDEVGRLAVEFPHGRLVQEREVLAIDCLAALGDGDAARARTRAFVHRFPQSPYLDHVRQLGQLDDR